MKTVVRDIRKRVLPNGLTVLTEVMDHIRSVSIGIWVKTGSRHEEARVNGISHFVEHMVFKGTRNRSAVEIARQMDSIGGNMDAFTGKETICFNAKVLDEHLPIALDLLSDLVLSPKFEARDITREKKVVLEEIKMDEDNPDLLVHELFTQNYWKGQPLGQPILGTKETVRAFDQDVVFENYSRRFRPGNLVISAAGNLDHARFARLVEDRFGGLAAGRNGDHPETPRATARIITRNKKALEQVQICLGVPAPHVAHADRFVSYLLNALLGGGMSSRLFQKIREEEGLVYSIYSDLNPYSDTGCMCVYAGTSRESATTVVGEIVKEFRLLKEKPVEPDELRRVKDQMKGNLMLSLESSSARMSNLARQEMYFDRFMDLDEIIERVEQVNSSDLQRMSQSLFQTGQIAVTVLGNLTEMKLPRKLLDC